MIPNDLLSKIRGHKLLPVQVEEVPRGLTFKGSLEELLDTANALGERAVFVTISLFDEGDLSYLPSGLDEDDDEAPGPSVDLATREPKLATYREQLGKLRGYTVFFAHSGLRILFSQEEDWYQNYLDLREKVIQGLLAEDAGKRAERVKKAEESQAQLLVEINALAEDSEFRSLPNKDLMRKHILKKFPEASDFPRRDMENLLATLYASAKRKR